MGGFEFVLAIIFITTAGSIWRQKLKNEAKLSHHEANSAYEQRFDAMEKRIQTLERIVTDQKTQLRDKIDSLNS